MHGQPVSNFVCLASTSAMGLRHLLDEQLMDIRMTVYVRQLGPGLSWAIFTPCTAWSFGIPNRAY